MTGVNDAFTSLEQRTASPWKAHPKFPGVSMKALVDAQSSNGRLSQYLVRVEAGCALETHSHPTQCELHLVIRGDAKASLGTSELEYFPGMLATIQAGCPHSVRAGEEGVTLLATFSPANA